MARSGDEIYDSDESFDALAEITDVVMKEAAYWFLPGQVSQSAWWLREILTLIEIMVIFTEDELDWQVHLMHQVLTIKHWREVFFHVWDAEWNDTHDVELPYSTYAYRVEHRQLIRSLFNHLYVIAEDGTDDLSEDQIDLVSDDMAEMKDQPFALQGQLPYFSIVLNGQAFFATSRFLSQFFDMLTCKIIFVLSEENREKEAGFDLFELEEVWVAIDLMRILSEKYQISPGLRPATIHRWLDTTIGLWLVYYADNPDKIVDIETLAEKEPLYTNSVNVFVRLITVAQQHPAGL